MNKLRLQDLQSEQRSTTIPLFGLAKLSPITPPEEIENVENKPKSGLSGIQIQTTLRIALLLGLLTIPGGHKYSSPPPKIINPDSSSDILTAEEMEAIERAIIQRKTIKAIEPLKTPESTEAPKPQIPVIVKTAKFGAKAGISRIDIERSKTEWEKAGYSFKTSINTKSGEKTIILTAPNGKRITFSANTPIQEKQVTLEIK
jgi:hypothetical protein